MSNTKPLLSKRNNGDNITINQHKETTAEKNAKEIKLLICVSIVCTMFMVTEIIGGIISGSLAILTDAAHLLSDLAGFAISIVALVIGSRAPTNSLTFGYHRAETVGALTSVLLIWALTFWLIYEAVIRIISPPKVEGKIMLIVAVLGLCANLIMMFMLRDSTTSGHSAHGDGEHDGSDEEGHGEGEGHDEGGHDEGGHDDAPK